MDPAPKVPSFRTVGLWLLSTMMLAAAGLAFAGQLGMAPVSDPVTAPTPCPTPSLPDGGEALDDPCPTPTPSPTGTVGNEEEEGVAPAVDPAREAACQEAAGIDDPEADAGLPPGLIHSTEVLLENCIKNPQSQGLLNALERHAENRARIAAKRAAREAKALARAERKAQKQAARAQGGNPSGRKGKH